MVANLLLELQITTIEDVGEASATSFIESCSSGANSSRSLTGSLTVSVDGLVFCANEVYVNLVPCTLFLEDLKNRAEKFFCFSSTYQTVDLPFRSHWWVDLFPLPKASVCQCSSLLFPTTKDPYSAPKNLKTKSPNRLVFTYFTLKILLYMNLIRSTLCSSETCLFFFFFQNLLVSKTPFF